jgi:hypothetical protein
MLNQQFGTHISTTAKIILNELAKTLALPKISSQPDDSDFRDV